MLYTVVLCEYSKFLIEANSYFSIRLEMSKLFEYLPSPISHEKLIQQNDLSNHAQQPTKSTNMESSASSRDSKHSLMWSHFKQIGSDNINMIRSDDNCSIRFEISNNSSTIRFDLIRNEKNIIRTALMLQPCVGADVARRMETSMHWTIRTIHRCIGPATTVSSNTARTVRIVVSIGVINVFLRFFIQVTFLRFLTFFNFFHVFYLKNVVKCKV